MKRKLLLFFALLPFAAAAQNNYLDFDGINDVVETPNTTATMLGNATALTLSCKVYPTRVTTGFPDFNGICGYRNESDFDFYLIQLSSTDLEARFRNSAGVDYTITYSGLTLNQWSQFFLVYNGTTLKLYKNGAEVASIPASGSVAAAPSGYLSIGRITFQTYYWLHKGYIDEVSVWNKALTQTDIDAIISNAGEIANPLSQSNLKVYYKFDQGIAYGNNAGVTTLIDELGANNGILANFALVGNVSNWGGAQLGIGENQDTAVSIFPNPAKDLINVSGLTAAADFRIYDMMGRIVKSQTVQPDEPLRIADLQPGLYIMACDQWQKKFIVK
jgi:hypothetical protein